MKKAIILAVIVLPFLFCLEFSHYTMYCFLLERDNVNMISYLNQSQRL